MRTVSVAKQHLPGEREVYIEARFGGLEMIVGDEHGEMLSANMIGTQYMPSDVHIYIQNLTTSTQSVLHRLTQSVK